MTGGKSKRSNVTLQSPSFPCHARASRNRCSIRIIHICVVVSHARKRDYSISLQLLGLTHICYLPVVVLTVGAEAVVVVLFEPEAK